MGWAERVNPNSEWNKKRSMNTQSNFASPISNSPNIIPVSTPARRQDEPMVIEITPRSLFALVKDFLCRMLRLKSRPRSHAQTS